MNNQELKLYNSKTPEDYIDNSLKTKIPSGRKAHITRLWLEKKKYTVDDIKRARNRHPYWKKKKMAGSTERNEQRRMEHDYRGDGSLEWDEDTVKEFIEMNRKDKMGRYENKDFELAQHFATTIPSIQHYRRKFNMVAALLRKEKAAPTVKRVYQYLIQSEQKLRSMLKGGGSGKKSDKKRRS